MDGRYPTDTIILEYLSTRYSIGRVGYVFKIVLTYIFDGQVLRGISLTAKEDRKWGLSG